MQSKMPLAVEFRHTDWYNDVRFQSFIRSLKRTRSRTFWSTLPDVATEHMRLTNANLRIPCTTVGANVPESDRERLDEWVDRIAAWKKAGLQNLYFFVHQNIEKESPLLSAYFIEKLNKKIKSKLTPPRTL
jgi:uncharacterized protein YecE (DUF72 family)